MHLLLLSPEVWPFTRVGGLADVSRDLAMALGARGHQVNIITPKCQMPPELEASLEPMDLELSVPVSWRSHPAIVLRSRLSPRVNLYLIDHDNLFDREGLYGNAFGDYEDNAERFIFFSRACLELALALGEPIEVVHAHDWTTGLVPLYLRTLYADHPQLRAAASVMTVHNVANQGVFWHYDMPLTGLGWEYFTPEGIEFYGKISFLKAGLVFADMISTVAPTYAREILTPEMGCGLDGVLLDRQDRLAVVPNGLDYSIWDPAHDPNLAASFDQDNLAPRELCQKDLRRELKLESAPGRALVALMGRMESRRGLDMIISQAQRLVEMGLDLVFMGYGEDRFHSQLRDLHRAHPDRVAVKIGFDDRLAHKMVAGADMILVPSRFEPCGLHQLQAMRYGTVPVVRATGGLDDTVDDHTETSPGTGFKFADFSTPAMLEAVGRALAAFRQPLLWRQIMIRGMAQDHSWQKSVPLYEDIYRQALEVHQLEEAGKRS